MDLVRPTEIARKPWVPPLLLLAVGVGMTVWTWGTWLHCYVDFGRELYVPWRISEGQVLFRDIAWFNGPLSQYWNALLFTIFGVALRTLVVANLVVLAGVCLLLYRLLRGMSDRFAATLGCAAFLFLCGFGQFDEIANFNWVCPYSHEMTHGVALAIVVTYLMTRWLRSRARVHAALGGVALGLVFLTKPEAFLAAALAAGTAFAAGWVRRAARTSPSDVAVFAGAAALPPIVAFLLLQTALPASEALRGVLGGWLHAFNAEIRALAFYQWGLGTDDLAMRLGNMFTWLGVWAAVTAPPVLVCLLLRRPGGGRAAACAIVGGLTFIVWYHHGIDWKTAWTPLPAVLLLLAVVAVGGLRRASRGRTWERAASSLVFLALAGGLLLKMLFNARLFSYGFGLAAPALALVVVALFGWIPRWVDAAGGYGAGVRGACLGVLAMVALGHGRVFQRWVTAASYPIGSGVDAFRSDEKGYWVGHVASEIRQKFPAETTLLVLPEGIMINYLARRQNPTRYLNFMPPEVILFGEESMLQAFQAQPPHLVILIMRDTKEYGLPLFGRDYAASLLAWVRRNYLPDEFARWGPEPLVPERMEDDRWSLWVYRWRGQ